MSTKNDAILRCSLGGLLCIGRNHSDASRIYSPTQYNPPRTCATTVRHTCVICPSSWRTKKSRPLLHLDVPGLVVMQKLMYVGQRPRLRTHANTKQADLQCNCSACVRDAMTSTASMLVDERDEFASKEKDALSRTFGILVCIPLKYVDRS
jgi:hypothetical protein